MALLALHAGLRSSELATLKVVEYQLGWWDYGSFGGKTGSRIAYLTDRATEMLKRRVPASQIELIFKKRCSRKGSESEGPMAQASKVFTDCCQCHGAE